MGSDASWEVREAGADDAERIGAFLHSVWEAAGPTAPGFSGATDEIVDEIARPEAVRARLGGPDRRIFVAVSGDDAIGFAATRREGEDLELAGIVVRAEWAGRGIGSRLVGAVLDLARREGVAHVTVRTEIDNARAIGFYESTGFTRGGRSTEQVGGTDIDVVELSRAP
jgi:ribosomal protein S18 acetylase RimI-like enzyme